MLRQVLELFGAGGFNVVRITNHGDLTDKEISLHIRGIRLVYRAEEMKPNVTIENDHIHISTLRPGDKLNFDVWTDEFLSRHDPDDVRASSFFGKIPISFP